MKNILYLREMGANDSTLTGDIKNHRVRVIENVNISYCGENYSMFSESF